MILNQEHFFFLHVGCIRPAVEWDFKNCCLQPAIVFAVRWRTCKTRNRKYERTFYTGNNHLEISLHLLPDIVMVLGQEEAEMVRFTSMTLNWLFLLVHVIMWQLDRLDWYYYPSLILRLNKFQWLGSI